MTKKKVCYKSPIGKRYWGWEQKGGFFDPVFDPIFRIMIIDCQILPVLEYIHKQNKLKLINFIGHTTKLVVLPNQGAVQSVSNVLQVA